MLVEFEGVPEPSAVIETDESRDAEVESSMDWTPGAVEPSGMVEFEGTVEFACVVELVCLFGLKVLSSPSSNTTR